jgi:hypothetical protein
LPVPVTLYRKGGSKIIAAPYKRDAPVKCILLCPVPYDLNTLLIEADQSLLFISTHSFG